MDRKLALKYGAIVSAVFLGLMVFFVQPMRSVNSFADGAGTYQQHCAVCHGQDGKANTPKGRRKGATDLTKSTIGTNAGIKVITNGRELMPAFKTELTAAEIREVMAYVSGFRR